MVKRMKTNPIIPVGPSIAYIPMTKGNYCLIDSENIDLICQWKWHSKKINRVAIGFYAYSYMGSEAKTVAMHRYIFGPAKERFIDHKNGNPLDNRRSNLRECNILQNMANQKIRTTNTSGYKGVSKIRGKYAAQICRNSKNRLIGYFDSAKEASLAYRREAILHDGEFMRIS